MNPRFTLVIVLVLLLGGAGALLYFSSGPQGPAPTPIASTPADSSSAAPVAPAKPDVPTRPVPDAHFVLAVSWEPAFCEGAAGKPECRSQTVDRFDTDHFSLHGLWPDDDYCSVSDALVSADKAGRWEDLPAPNLSKATRAALDEVMPGTQSLLERHERLKHGTCARATADTYFARAVALVKEINRSPVRDLFASRLGSMVSLSDIRGAFDRAFGGGAGSRVRVACEQDGDRRIVTEITVGLFGAVMGSAPLSQLIAGANPTRGGCESGVVDHVGLQ